MKGRKEWQRQAGQRAVDSFLGGRPIRVFDRYGRRIGTRVEVNCPSCDHWAEVVVPGIVMPKFRCSKCGALAVPAHEDA